MDAATPQPIALRLSLDTAQFQRDAELLLQLAQSSPEVLDVLSEAVLDPSKLVRLYVDGSSAAHTGEVRIRLQFADRLRILLPATGAGENQDA